MARPQVTPHAPPPPALPPVVEVGLFLLLVWLLAEAAWFLGRPRTRSLALAVVQARGSGRIIRAAAAVAWAVMCDMLGQAAAVVGLLLGLLSGHSPSFGGFGSCHTTKADASGGWTRPAWATVMAPPVENVSDGQGASAARRGTRTLFHDWRPPEGASDAEVETAVIGNALLRAIELRLAAPSPEGGMKGLANHRLVLRRAFLDRSTGEPFAGYVLAVERADSAAADPAAIAGLGEKLHKLTKDVLAPSLAHFAGNWTPAEIGERLFVGDRRAADSAGRAGTLGSFVRWAMAAEAVPDNGPDQGEDRFLAAIRSGLRAQSQPADLFRPMGAPMLDYKKVTYRFRSDHWTQTNASGSVQARLELERIWSGLADAVSMKARHDDKKIKLWGDRETGEFVLELTVNPPPFPGDKPRDERVLLVNFLKEHGEEMRREDPRRFCVGVDYRGDPHFASFARQPHGGVFGTTGSGKTIGGVIGPMLQLAAINSPDVFGMWIVDSKEEVHLFLADLPHTRRLIKPEGLDDVLPLLREFNDEALRRRHAYAGQDWRPGCGDPFLVLVIEEWLYLVEHARGTDAKKALEQVTATIKGIGAIARQVGCHVLIASQDAKNETVPSTLLGLLPLRMAGSGIGDAHLRVIFGETIDTEKVRIEEDRPGRMAVKGAIGANPIVVQALWSHDRDHKPPRDIERFIADIRDRWPKSASAVPKEHVAEPDEQADEPSDLATGRLRPAPVVAPRANRPFSDLGSDNHAAVAPRSPHAFDPRKLAAGDEPAAPVARTLTPRQPTAAEVKQMDAATAARIVWRHALAGDEVSRARLVEYVRAEGLQAPDAMRLSLTLRDLEELGLLVNRSADQRKAGLRAALDWPAAASKLLNSGAKLDDDLF